MKQPLRQALVPEASSTLVGAWLNARTSGADDEWNPHPEFTFLDVTRDGRVRYNKKTRKKPAGFELKQFVNKKGYKFVCVVNPGAWDHQRTMMVHRLVAQTYLENPNGYGYVNHMDGNKQNNDVSNLEWCTASQNTRHAIRTGLTNKSKRGKLTEDRVRLMRLLNTYCGMDAEQLAGPFGVCYDTALRAVTYRTWKHVGKEAKSA